MEQLIVTIHLVDDDGNEVDEAINRRLPGFKNLFLRAYSDGVDYFNDHIEEVNHTFEILYPDHEIDMYDKNDPYNLYVQRWYQPFYDKLSKKYLGESGIRFGLFGECSSFAVRFTNGYTISMIIKPVDIDKIR